MEASENTASLHYKKAMRSGAGIDPAHEVCFVTTVQRRAGSQEPTDGYSERVVPGAGIQPARLSAGDFESSHDLNRGVACGLIIAA